VVYLEEVEERILMCVSSVPSTAMMTSMWLPGHVQCAHVGLGVCDGHFHFPLVAR
jgi:hypothetical protein